MMLGEELNDGFAAFHDAANISEDIRAAGLDPFGLSRRDPRQLWNFRLLVAGWLGMLPMPRPELQSGVTDEACKWKARYLS